MEVINYKEKPSLNKPLLIVGIAGWADAGEISSGSLFHLKKILEAREFAFIPTEEFYNFTKLRPVVNMKEGLINSITFPSNTFYYTKGSESSSDCILFDAVEPHLDWDGYIRAILDLAKRFNVHKIVTIGGVIDEIPHTLEPQVTALASEEAIQNRLRKERVWPIDYVGPSSIHGQLLEKAHREGFRFISLWGHCPNYIQEKNPSVCYKVLVLLKELTGISLDLQDLKKERQAFEERLDLELQKNSELRHLILAMEKANQEGAGSEGKEETGGEKVIEITAFVKEVTTPPEEDSGE